MRSRVVGSVAIAAAVAFAGPAWCQGHGGGHGGGHSGGHFSGAGRSAGGHGGRGGGHSGSPGHGWGGAHGHAGHPRYHTWRGGHGWPGYFGWDLSLGFPFWWDVWWPWGWPYGWYGAYPYPYPYPSDTIAYVPPADETSAPATTEAPVTAPAAAITLPSGPTPVDIEVSPPSAFVELNGVVIGSVDEFDGRPDCLYLDRGKYTIAFQAPGYRSVSLTLNAGTANRTIVSLDLEPATTTGAPPAVAPSPGLPYGRRFDPSFGPAKADASAPPTGSAVRAANPSSAALTAFVLHVSPPDAAVYIDGALIGSGESVAHLPNGVAVTPGEHRIDVVAPRHAGKTVQARAEAGTSQELTIALD
jgi:hypothetical protein